MFASLGATAADRELAGRATQLLADRGRTDLSVSASQVRKWRQIADALPVLSDRQPGRKRMTVYAPEAAETAALIRIYLAETDRNLDKAVLGAFAEGAHVPEEGLRSALCRCLHDMKVDVEALWEVHDRPRSELPRRLRGPLATRGALGSLASDAALAVLLGKEPMALRDTPMIILEAMFVEAIDDMASALKPELLAAVSQDYSRMDLATLLRESRKVDIEKLRVACRQGQIISACLAMELMVLLVSALACGMAGEELDALFSGPDRAPRLLAAAMGMKMGLSLFSDPSRAVVVGLELLVLSSRGKRTQEWQELADRLFIRLQFYVTFLGMMLCLRPLHLSEVLGPTQMTEEEREHYVEEGFEWLLSHAEEVRAAFATEAPGLDDDAPEA